MSKRLHELSIRPMKIFISTVSEVMAAELIVPSARRPSYRLEKEDLGVKSGGTTYYGPI